jgi:two-component system, response regulator
MKTEATPLVLMADDDEDDCLLARHAFEACGAHGAFECVGDGMALLNYLSRSPLPALILIDINMPLMDGFEALKAIKSIPAFQDIPVVVVTTSGEEKDMANSRKLGADSFFTKPSRFNDWINMMKSLSDRWLEANS